MYVVSFHAGGLTTPWLPRKEIKRNYRVYDNTKKTEFKLIEKY